MSRPDAWDKSASELRPVRLPPADVALGGDFPFRPMTISEMLDGAIAGIRTHPKATLGLSVLVTTVIQVTGSVAAYYFIGERADTEISPGWLLRSVGAQLTLGAIGLVLSAFGILVLAGLLSPVLGRGMFGLPGTARQAWRDARPRFPRLVATAVVIMLAALLGLLLPMAPFLACLAVDAPPAAGVVFGIVGIPAGLALMIWLYVLLVLAAPAVIMERETVGGALRRAWRLSKGRWWRTCGTLLAAMLITVFMGYFALRIPFLVVELIFFSDDAEGGKLILGLAVDTLGRIVGWSVVLPFDAGVIALLYMDRRMRREGLDLELRTRARASAPAPDRDDDDDDVPAGEDDEFLDMWRPQPPPSYPAPSYQTSGPQGPPSHYAPTSQPPPTTGYAPQHHAPAPPSTGYAPALQHDTPPHHMAPPPHHAGAPRAMPPHDTTAPQAAPPNHSAAPQTPPPHHTSQPHTPAPPNHTGAPPAPPSGYAPGPQAPPSYPGPDNGAMR
ncbi:hypothetical protein [Spirillospora sp. CA-294931]|uniref:hypothetical protein n=1 Tax=Spirillospora sp. CA-294931 TaxID=3240042 RepID=UPI003D9403CC